MAIIHIVKVIIHNCKGDPHTENVQAKLAASGDTKRMVNVWKGDMSELLACIQERINEKKKKKLQSKRGIPHQVWCIKTATRLQNGREKH